MGQCCLADASRAGDGHYAIQVAGEVLSDSFEVLFPANKATFHFIIRGWEIIEMCVERCIWICEKLRR